MPPPISRAVIERWRTVSQADAPSGIWAATLRESSWWERSCSRAAAVGLAPPLPLSDDYEIGWHLHPDHWGHGFATETGVGLMRRAFDVGLREVLAVIYPANEKSKQVARRIGMEYAGRTSRYYNVELDLFRATVGRHPPVQVIQPGPADRYD